MASEEHLTIIKQGIVAWNAWREEHPLVRPDLTFAQLNKQDFWEARGPGRVVCADLSKTDLTSANLDTTDLRGVYLQEAILSRARLQGANLSGAYLGGANLHSANLGGADVANSTMGNTVLTNIDFRTVKGLEDVHHDGPSTIGVDTIFKSQGEIPEIFLRGAGIPESVIIFMRSITDNSFEFYSCFISYSSKDQEFATRLHTDLQSKGVRCWFAPDNLKIGDKLRPSFDEAIRTHDKLMVILTENSVKSTWVEKEVETAFEKERKQERIVLFPIRLDDVAIETKEAWAADIHRTRHIGDFRNWKDRDSYKKSFERLLRDLKSEAKVASTAHNE